LQACIEHNSLDCQEDCAFFSEKHRLRPFILGEAIKKKDSPNRLEGTMKRMMLCLLTGILLAGCSGGEPISHVYAFGDGLSDNGNYYELVKQAGDTEMQKWMETYYTMPYASNGPVAVKVLADRLNVDLTDYAVVGSGWGDEGVFIYANGLMNQVDQFEASLNGQKADPNALYFIFMPSEVLSYIATAPKLRAQYKPEEWSAFSLENNEKAITRLAGLGAKRFLVVNMVDMAIQPEVRDNQDTGAMDWAVPVQEDFNASLPDRMKALAKELGVTIQVFDHPALSERIRSNPGQYSLTNLDEQCVEWTEVPDGWPTGETCASPDGYYFYDERRPTRRVHEIIGEAIYEFVNK
jgi:phospholipase/lecithinase/hemolysin